MQLNRICALVILGMLLGILLSFSPGSFFMLILTIGTVFLIYQLSDKNERNFILAIFLAGLGLRIVLILLVSFGAIFSGRILNFLPYGSPDFSTPYIFDDSGYYTLRAQFTSMHWLGEPLSQFTLEGMVKIAYGLSGFIYILAGFFSLFGYSPIASRLINAFLGSLSIILVYSITKNIFNPRPARLAAILTAVFPSVLLWSITNLKETSLMFAALLMLWSLIKFQKTKHIFYLLITAFSIWFQGFIRFSYRKEFLFLIVAVALFYLIYLFLVSLSWRKRIVVLSLIAIIGGGFFYSKREYVNLAVQDTLGKVLIQHRGSIGSGGINYKLLPEVYYVSQKQLTLTDFYQMLGRGWFHTMLEPLPWRSQSKSMLITFPQMALWYPLLGFAILGVAISLRYSSRQSMVLLIFFLVKISTLAVTGGNVGTIFRLRDVNTPIILIFAAIGLSYMFLTLEKRNEQGQKR